MLCMQIKGQSTITPGELDCSQAQCGSCTVVWVSTLSAALQGPLQMHQGQLQAIHISPETERTTRQDDASPTL